MSEMAESFEEAPSESWAQPGSTTRAKVRDDRRLRWLLAAAVLFAVSTFLALNQPTWPYPCDPPRTFSFDWWTNPVEHNPEQRLPWIGSEINAVWASDEGERMWAVGDDGLVVRSDDGGESWRKVETGGRAESEGPTLSRLWSWPGGTATAAPQDASDDLAQTGPRQTTPRQTPDQEQQTADPAQPGPLPASWFEALRVNWEDTSPFELATDLPSIDLHAVSFRDESHGWIGGADGYLLRTEDGGESWRQRRLPRA